MRFVIAISLAGTALWAAEATVTLTFNRDVLPILRRNCQNEGDPRDAPLPVAWPENG